MCSQFFDLLDKWQDHAHTVWLALQNDTSHNVYQSEVESCEGPIVIEWRGVHFHYSFVLLSKSILEEL